MWISSNGLMIFILQMWMTLQHRFKHAGFIYFGLWGSFYSKDKTSKTEHIFRKPVLHWPVKYWSLMFNETIFKPYVTFCLGPTQLFQSPFWQCSGIITTVSFTGAMSSRFLQRVNGMFPNRSSFSGENKDPLGLVFLKQNGQKLSLDNFRVYFSSVTGSKWEGRHLKHDIF